MRLNSFISILISAVLIAACGKLNYKKSPGGFPYIVFSDGKGERLKVADIVKFHIENKVNDSVYKTTFGSAPAYVQTSLFGERYDISEIWTQLRVGDSVIVIQALDTFIKRNSTLPPEIKKGDRLIITMKVLGVFESDSLAELDKQIDKDMQLVKDKEAIKQYLKENKIEDYQENKLGVFVKIHNPGSGNLIDSGNHVSVKYKGIHWSGEVFDTNMDSTFGRTAPMDFTVDVSPMMKGFAEGVKMMRKGAEATIYIPSALAYGAEGNPPTVNPNEKVIFEIKVLDVKDQAPKIEPVLPTPADSIKGKVKRIKA